MRINHVIPIYMYHMIGSVSRDNLLYSYSSADKIASCRFVDLSGKSILPAPYPYRLDEEGCQTWRREKNVIS